jgi:hypothetical protein
MAPPDRGLRLPDAGFDVIVRILKAYLAAAKGQAGTPVKLDDVVRRAGGGRTQVSGQNAFLATLGIITGGHSKQLTPTGRRLGLAVDHPDTDEYVAAWRAAIEQSEDLGGIVDSVRVRMEMTTDALLSHIVLTAGVAKNNRSLTGARTVIEVLKAGGVLLEADGTFRAGPTSLGDDPVSLVKDPARQQKPPEPDASAPEVPHAPPGSDSPALTVARAPGVQVHIHVWLSLSDASAPDVAERVQALVEKLTSDGA